MQSMILADYIGTSASSAVQQEMWTSIRDDEIGTVAKSDRLILALGESWLRRNVDIKVKRHNYVSQYMPLLARLLLTLTEMDLQKEDQG